MRPTEVWTAPLVLALPRRGSTELDRQLRLGVEFLLVVCCWLLTQL